MKMNINAAQRFIIVLQIVDGYCTRLLPVSCVGTGIKKLSNDFFFQEPFTLITVQCSDTADFWIAGSERWPEESLTGLFC